MCATECRQPEGAFPGKSKASSVNLGEILHLVHSCLVRTLNQSISPRFFFFLSPYLTTGGFWMFLSKQFHRNARYSCDRLSS